MKNYIVLLFLLLVISGCRFGQDLVSEALNNDQVATHSGQDSEYSFIVMGDSRNNPEKFEELLDIVNSYKPQYMFHLGDLVHKSSEELLTGSRKSLDKLDDSIETEIVIGNHDVQGESNMDRFNRIFGYSKSFKGYDSFDYDGNHFILLNSFEIGKNNVVKGEQLEWLKQDLEKNSVDKTTFIFLHSPMFKVGKHSPLENASQLHELFLKYNVEAVFAAHEHLYYYEKRDGIHYFVTGGAGAPLYKATGALSIYHLLGINTSSGFEVDVIDDNGQVIKSIE